MLTSKRSAVSVETGLGPFGLEVTESGLARVWLPGSGRTQAEDDVPGTALAHRAGAQLEEYVRGVRQEFDLELDWSGVSPEHRLVLETLREIAPYGHTVTYGELGARAGVGDPRDVGLHMNRNPLPVVIPCHRVVASDGLGGYGGGLALKRRLLELEGVLPASLDLGDV